MATLPGAWRYRVSAEAGWSGASILQLQFLSQSDFTYNCLSRSVLEIHQHVAGTLSNQPTNELLIWRWTPERLCVKITHQERNQKQEKQNNNNNRNNKSSNTLDYITVLNMLSKPAFHCQVSVLIFAMHHFDGSVSFYLSPSLFTWHISPYFLCLSVSKTKNCSKIPK